MATDAGLIVALEARLNKFEKGLKEAGAVAERQVDSIERKFSKMNPALPPFITKFAKGFAAAFSVDLLASGVQRAVADLAKLGDVAQRIDVSTDALQALRFEVQQNGGELGDADNALQKFADTLGEAAVGGNYLSKVLESNNIELRDKMTGNLRGVDALLADFARLVAGAGSAQEKMMLVTEAFGRRAGPQMLLALEQIARKGLPNVISEAKAAGVVVDEELIKKAQQFDDAWEKATLQASVAIKSFVVRALEGIQRVGEALGNTGHQQIGNEPSTMEGFLPPSTAIIVPAAAASEEVPLPRSRPGAAPRIPAKAWLDEVGAIEKHTRAMQLNAEMVGLTVGEQARLRIERELTQILLEKGIPLEGEYAQTIRRLGDEAAAAAEKEALRKHAFEQSAEASREFGSALSDGFKSAVLEGQKLDEVLRNLTSRLAGKAIDKLFDLFFLAGPTGGSSVAASLFSALFGGARADGGPVSAGRAYLVGERGPEMFVPRGSGQIVPNAVNARRGGGAVNMAVTFQVDGAVAKSEIVGMITEGMAIARAQAVAISTAQAPVRLQRWNQLGT